MASFTLPYTFDPDLQGVAANGEKVLRPVPKAADPSDAERAIPDRSKLRARAFVLRLSFPPPAFQRYRRVAGIGRVKTAHYRRWLLDSGARLSGSSARRIGGPVSVDLIFPPLTKLSAAAGILMPAVQFLAANGLVDGERSVERLSIKRQCTAGTKELRIQVRGL